MFKDFFHTIFFEPLYNALVFLSSALPGHDIGWAIIILTLIVKFALLPLYRQSLYTQRKMKEIEPAIKELREKYKNNQEQAQKLMELYRENKINPFAGIMAILIQIPIFLALFFVFKDSFVYNQEWLYSFVRVPESVNTLFLGVLDLTERSVVVAVLVGITQFLSMKFSLPELPKKASDAEPNFKEDLARSMHIQMKYVMPVIMGFITLSFPAAVALYWLVSNLFAIGNELLLKRRIIPKAPLA
ncbi:MAG TPA: YidC/Oxa1 family membrane protein insertase [Candidatus Paceibacterota bacterium]|nr:YidC/Oxa1 family membrane protein insertase [Candidatus Paceibacterota bacterium]